MSTPLDCGQILRKKGSNFHCCVPFCNSDSRYDPTIHFHHIPKDEQLKKQWIQKIRRDEGPLFRISTGTVVCSKHFGKDDYVGWTPIRKRLKKGAVPSVFNWSQEKTTRRTLNRKVLSPKKRKHTESDECGLTETYGQTSTEEQSLSCEEQPKQICIDKTELLSLKEDLEQKSAQCNLLEKQLKLEKFDVNRFSTDACLIQFYTGFPNYNSYVTFFKCIEPSAQNMRSMYYHGSEVVSLSGRKRNMLLIDELFMFLCRLRVGLMEQDLSVRFNCSISTVSRKIITWVNFMYIVLGSVPIWLSRAKVNEYMPDCFKSLYPKTRVIVDCTEIRTQQPSSLVLNSQMYSNYKGACTFKSLLGISPHGLVTFISSLYTGCMSDVEITKLSGILDLLEPGDDVMADKGFTLRKVLSEKQVTLNIPAFLRSKNRFTPEEIKETEQIAKLRIHIERVNRRIKENHLFDTPIPMSLAGSANQLWTVACLLCNFRGPIVQSWTKD